VNIFFQTNSDESVDVDIRRNDEKVYNLTDILSASSSDYYREQQEQHKKQFYLHNQLFYPPPTLSSSSTSAKAKEKAKKPERYYIYSHVTRPTNDAENRGHYDKGQRSRQARSSSSKDVSPSERKQISRNISLVLENLLMSYENSQLPTHGEGSCFVICLKFTLK
jgi:hypothetical protein